MAASSCFSLGGSAFASFFSSPPDAASAAGAAATATGAALIASSMFTSAKDATSALTCASFTSAPLAFTIFVTFSSVTFFL